MSDAYSRLYHRFAKEFRAIYDDDRALATWVRLLMLADASWPMRPPLPRSAKRHQVAQLLACGLLILDGEDYTILGLDAERTRRRDAGRTGAAKRWQSDGNANASATAMPRRDETSKEETRGTTPPPPAGRRENGTNPRSLGTNPRAAGTNPRAARKAEKVGPTSLGQVLRRAADLGRGAA